MIRNLGSILATDNKTRTQRKGDQKTKGMKEDASHAGAFSYWLNSRGATGTQSMYKQQKMMLLAYYPPTYLPINF